MLVRNWKNPTVISVEAQASMADALQLMKENKIKTLPVFERGSLVGVVTDRDLKRASASDATLLEIHELLHLLTQVRIRNIMSRNPITIPDKRTSSESNAREREHRHGAVSFLGLPGSEAQTAFVHRTIRQVADEQAILYDGRAAQFVIEQV